MCLNGIGNRKFIDRIVNLLSCLEKHVQYTEYLNQIKTSGYFSLIYTNSRAMYTKEISNVFLLPNEILKKIYIYDKKKKLISHTFLRNLFQKQIGYPKNFVSLNLALSKIMKWYSDRGYQWSLVEIKQTDDPSSLMINIHEGLVKTITIEYYTLSRKKVHSISCLESIEQYLGVRVGIPLNINYLQKKITYLKDNQLVGNIIYSIERSNNDSMSLNIKFQIQELKDKEIIVLTENFSKAYPFIFHSHNSLGQYRNFSNWLVASNIISPSTSKLQACYLNSELDDRYRYINISHIIRLLGYSISYRKTLISNYFNLQTLLSWTKNKTIGFQLYLRNLSRRKSFCIFSTKFIQNGLKIKIFYLDPSLIIDQNFSFQFAIQIIKQCYTNRPSTLSLFLTHVDLAQYTAESVFIYRFTPCFSISEKILLSRVLHIDSLFYNSENFNFNVYNKSYRISNYNIFKQNAKLFHQEFLSLLFNLRYQNFNYLGWPLKGYLFEIKSLYLAPFQKSNFLSCHFFNSCKQLFFHKIFLKQVSNFNLPIYFRNYLNHILVSTTKIQSNLNMETVSLLLSDYPIKHVLYKSILNFSVKMKIEYFIPISNSMRVSLFCNYLDCFLMRPSKRLTYISQDVINRKQIQNFLLEKLSYGFGIQLKLPIREVPPLSIEYTISSSHHFCIHLHIYYQR